MIGGAGEPLSESGTGATDDSRPLQDEVEPAPEAESEDGVEEGRDEGHGRRDRERPWHAYELQHEPTVTTNSPTP